MAYVWGFGLVSPRIGYWERSHSRQSTAALPLSRIPSKNWASSAKCSGLFSSNHSVSITECVVFLNSTRASDNSENNTSSSFAALIFSSTYWGFDRYSGVVSLEKQSFFSFNLTLLISSPSRTASLVRACSRPASSQLRTAAIASG